MTKKLAPLEKVNRRPISRACAFCHQKHLQCDSGRPCNNCTKRGLQDTCRDVERKRAKYLTENESTKNASKLAQTPMKKLSPPEIQNPTTNNSTPQTRLSTTPSTARSFKISDVMASPANGGSNLFNSNNNNDNRVNQLPPPHIKSRSNTNTESSEVFSSLFANQEYAQLADLLDNNSVQSPSQSSVQNYNMEFQTSLQTDKNTRPFISLSDNTTATYNQPIVSADLVDQTTEYTSPLILRHLIKIPDDVYSTSLQPYNYPKAYHALLNYLKARFKREELIQIAETMAEYRPSFIAATRSLVELDLLFAERSFQRSLLEYESMSSLSSSPTIMWRRTGEIVAVSTEFSSLTSHTKTELLSKRTFIIELMNDNSALDYFKLFSSVAFGDLNGVIITECTLLSPFGEEIRCASTWTVKRDVFDIPMLIVGQFLPILQVK